jgi:NAD(P)H-flavin reductase
MSTLERVAPTPDPLLVPRVHHVISVRDEIPDVVTLRVVPVEGEPAGFRPGQIGMVGAFGVGEAAISISSATTQRAYHDYTIRRAGAITQALTRLVPGDQLWVRGPFGTAWDLDLDGSDVLIAAGGIGIAPLRSAIYQILRDRERYGQAVLVVGSRSSAQLLYSREYEEWREHGLAVFDTIDAEEPGRHGRVGFVSHVVADAIRDLGLDPGRTAALVCGPDIMTRLTADVLVAHGVPIERVQVTLERNMQCGNGLCGHCQLGPIVVCRDGPVVPWSTVADAMGVPEY